MGRLNLQIKVKKLSQIAKIPKKHDKLDAAFDLYSIESITLNTGETAIIHTGISMEIPQGFYGQIKGRSSMASNGIFVTGGVIDSGYRGEIMVILNSINLKPYSIKSGDRIAQMVFQKVEDCEIIETTNLDTKNDRGGGLGSSGT